MRACGAVAGERRRGENERTHGDPQSVSAIIALGKDRAKPKSATLRIGTPSGWPLCRSSSDAGFNSRFYKPIRPSTRSIREDVCTQHATHLGLDVPVYEVPLAQELERAGYTAVSTDRAHRPEPAQQDET